MVKQQRNKKGRFLPVANPRKYLKRLTKEENELIDTLRKKKELKE